MNKLFFLLTPILFFNTTLVFAEATWVDATNQINYHKALGLPPFCNTEENKKKYNNRNWKKVFGGDITWSNHYCMYKAKSPICYKYPIKQKNACLKQLAKGILYGIEHSKNPNYKLLPLLYTEYGIVQAEIGHNQVSIDYFRKSINKNKKYTPAYSHLADLYIKLKQYDEAEIILKSGLKYKKSKALTRKLQKLKATKH